MTISVRRLDVPDVPALRELRLESLRLHPECFGADLEAEEVMTVADMAARMHSGYSFGGFVDGALSGLVVFVKPNRRKTGHTGELGAMYVIPIIYVPILMITHVASLYLLVRAQWGRRQSLVTA